MDAGVDPYAVLGVTPGAGDAEIHAAYRAEARRTHPDAGGSAAAFEAVQEAYEVLRDPARRRGREAPPPSRRQAPPRTPPVAWDPTELRTQRTLQEEEASRVRRPPFIFTPGMLIVWGSIVVIVVSLVLRRLAA